MPNTKAQFLKNKSLTINQVYENKNEFLKPK
jgi:hypothetical protein